MRSAAIVGSLVLALSVAACGDNLAGNAPPDVADRSAATPEDTPVTINIIAEDPENAPLSFTYSNPANGTLTGSGTSVTYRPDDDYHGPDAFTVTVSDGEHATEARISITVMPVNDDPVAGDDALAADEDTAATVDVATLLANDTDVDGDTLDITALGKPSSGSAALDAGVVTYTPAADFTGTATFEYTLSDGAGGTDTGVVTVTVGGENDPPVAMDDAFTTAEDTALVLPSTMLTANDTDPEGQTLTVTMVSGATGGTVDLAGGTVTFTPTANFHGDAGFDYEVSDGAATDTGHVDVTVTPVNDTPVATAVTATTAEDTAVTITLAGTDVDGDALTFAAAAGPANGTLGAITQVTPTTATVVYTPTGNFNGGDSFTFTAGDGTATSPAATVTITVTAANDPPVATAGTATTAEDTAVTITLAGTDLDGDPLTFAAATPPTSGTLGAVTQVTPTTATVVYTPNSNFNGGDSFTFTVNDGTATSPAAAVMITVTPVNDPPVATAGNATTAEDTAVTITLAGTDADGDPLTFAIAMPPATGTLGAITQVTPTTATVTYTPASNSTADDAFTFTVNDGTATSAAAAVTIDVTPVNDPPIAVNDSDIVERNTPRVQPFSFYLGNDSDGGDGGPLTITAVDLAVNGTVAITAGNTITFTPDTDHVGAASFVYTVSDGSDTATAAVSLTVVLTNTPIVAVDDDDTTPEDTELVRDATFYTANDTDPDPQMRTITAVHDAVNGSVVLVGTTITFTPTPDFNGAAEFQYTVSDGFATDVGLVQVDVTPVNDAPDAVDDVATAAEDGSIGVDVLVNDTNDDGPLTILVFTQGANGTVTQTLNTLTYAPAADFHGTDSFTYTVEDAGGLTDTATVTVTVTPVNDAPIFADQELTVPENAAVILNLSATDVDVPAQQLTFTVDNPPDHGTLGPITSTGPTTATVTYTPDPDYVGDDFMHFTVSDGTDSDLGIVVLHLTNVVVCGDGQIEGAETCDDNGVVAGDGCGATCQVELGWACTGAPSACDTVCGDTIVIAGEEQCDDGNAIDTDGCTTQCVSGPECSLAFAPLAGGDRFVTDPATGHCYASFDDDQATFADAQTACIAAGGHLASITSAEEQGLVASIHNTLQNPWIGLTDELVEGSFGWITGEPLSFNGFATGQPDGPLPDNTEDCVNLFAAAIAPAGETSRWNDTSCTFIGFVEGRICELDASSCGDGILHTARGEACDDGNTDNFDGCNATCQLETLFFSEYVEGSSNNKAIELANPSEAARDLTGCALRLYTNGNPVAGATLNLTQTIPAQDVIVFCHPSASATVLAACDVVVPTSPSNQFIVNWNGDDAIELTCGGATVDVLGQIGNDPGSEWGTGLTSTADNTLRRRCSVTIGDTVGNDAFDPSLQWGGFAQDTFDGLGTYNCVP